MSNSFPSLNQSARAFPLPTIAEDTLHYTLHLPSSSSTTGPSSSTSQEPAALALLLTQYVESLLIQPWLWNKDTFELKVSAENPASPKLEGRMRVGDAVDDEWLVVYLLRQISINHPDLIISIRDSDGEFLLIEAANELPSWVTPENAENRLWLMGGGLHLIPLNVRSGGQRPVEQFVDDEDDVSGGRRGVREAWISEEDAIMAVRTGKYRAAPKLENAVWDRIACYPDALKTHQHHTKAYLPVPIAKALAISPELIQRAVEGFYTRDPSQLRTASRMSHFPPTSSILTPITLTRAAYAQLQGQVFHPPRIFGPEWHVRQEDGEEGQKLEGERRWRDLGVKIATGFEIMYKEGGKKGRSGEADVDIIELRKDTSYQKYIADLQKAGFFSTELEGSEGRKAKEDQAAKGWHLVRSADTAQRPSFAFQVDKAISDASILPVSSLETTASSPEDDDSWLEVSPDELDGMMLKASGTGKGDAGRSVTATDHGNATSRQERMELGEEHGQALQDLAKKVEEFVGGQGDVEGARFDDELSDDDMLGDDDEDDQTDSDDNAVNELTAAEKEERMKNLVPGLTAEEWGRKPIISTTTAVSATHVPSKPANKSPKDSTLPKMRPPILAKEEYDGVAPDSDDDMSSEDEADLPPPGTLGRRIAEMKWGEGEIKDGEAGAKIEELEKNAGKRNGKGFNWDDGIDQEMKERVWGGDDTAREVDPDEEGDVDMGEEEEEFLKFSREALGISDEMWEGILDSRRARGAFVPKASGTGEMKPSAEASAPILNQVKFEAEPLRTSNISSERFGSVAPATPFAPRSRPERASPANGEMNMDLDSFEKVMQAMDAELAKARTKTNSAPNFPSNVSTTAAKNGKGKKKTPSSANPLPPLPTEQDLDDMDEDDLLAMDRELKAALKGAGIDSDEEYDELDVEEAKELDEEGKREYKMMRDFLESYRSQGGQSGVVGNLFGRLGGDGK